MPNSEKKINITVNGEPRCFFKGIDYENNTTLAELLKDKMGLTGLKIGCNEGACGACTIIMDGQAVLSCMTLAVETDGSSILTIEGLKSDDPVVRAFAEQCDPGLGTAMQCGYCTPGFVMTAKAFLAETPCPEPEQVRQALSGNLCRCGCYPAVSRAVMTAAGRPGAGKGRVK